MNRSDTKLSETMQYNQKTQVKDKITPAYMITDRKNSLETEKRKKSGSPELFGVNGVSKGLKK